MLHRSLWSGLDGILVRRVDIGARRGHFQGIAIELIDTPDDPRLADYRMLGEPRLLRERGLFVAEGRLVVRRAIEARRFVVSSVLVNRAALAQLDDSIAALPPGTPVYVCAPSAFADITGFNIHRGCLAIVERPPALPPDHVIRDARLVVVTEAIANPDNIGGIFRNAAAFAASAVLMDPSSGDPLYRKAIRTSMAATLSVPFATMEPWPESLDGLRRAGFTIGALTPAADAEPLREFAASWVAGRAAQSRSDVARVFQTREKLALLLGTEGAGLSDAAFRYADVRVRIDIDRAVDSLNVAVAAGIALYELTRGAGL